SAFTQRAGLTSKFTPNLAAYANYSESFQPLVAQTANGYAVTGSLKPQQGDQSEVGLKYQPDGFDGLFNLALFDLTQT
ncbi:TonB-dependent receptor domain-containing protein, partial [Rhizobium ruizarguesonis]